MKSVWVGYRSMKPRADRVPPSDRGDFLSAVPVPHEIISEHPADLTLSPPNHAFLSTIRPGSQVVHRPELAPGYRGTNQQRLLMHHRAGVSEMIIKHVMVEVFNHVVRENQIIGPVF